MDLPVVLHVLIVLVQSQLNAVRLPGHLHLVRLGLLERHLVVIGRHSEHFL